MPWRAELEVVMSMAPLGKTAPAAGLYQFEFFFAAGPEGFPALGTEDFFPNPGNGQPGDFLERFENAEARNGGRLDVRRALGVEEIVERLDRNQVGQIPFVE